MTRAVYYCADLGVDTVVLDGPEGRHAATVRRTRLGEVVDLVDGRGTRCTATVATAGKDTLTLEVTARVQEPLPSPRVTLVQAIPKGDRGELAVETATEAGVDEVLPWAAARCVARWEGQRGVKAVDRWRATAREAAKQSRRAWFPVVGEPVTTAEIAALPGTLLVLHESATVRLAEVPMDGDVVLVVGPEGGISDEELAAFRAAGATAVRLGSSVLRTSTAGVAAIAVVSARTGRW